MAIENPDQYQKREMLAVTWSQDMNERFPAADHTHCKIELYRDENGEWRSYDPVRCHGWHCNRCGTPTSSLGTHDCPDRP